MSLLNAVISPTRAVVAVDTEASSMDRVTGQLSRLEACKLFPLLHANVLLGTRGSHMFHAPVLFGLMTVRTPSFDAMAFALKHSLLKDAVTNAHASLRAAGAPASIDIGDQEIYLFGWSEAQQRMCGMAYFRDAGHDAWEAVPVTESWAVPWADHWGDLPIVVESNLEQVARDQVRLTRADSADVPIGGRLIVAELTKDATSVRAVASLT